jgi:ribulose-5-phosphate 4-epimerase/fuculose-1-phosphate aldolase
VLIREDLGTELARVTRILSYAGALATDGRITVLAGEVVYIAAREVSNATMAPHDIAIVRLADADVLRGAPPHDIERYLAVYRQRPLAKSVAMAADGSIVHGLSLLACAKATLLRADPEDRWERAEGDAAAHGAFIGLVASEG